MKPSAHEWRTFYRKLGYLCYAIAAAEKEIHRPEIEKMHELIRDRWVPIEPTVDAFGTDAAYQAETVFDWLDERHVPARQAFGRFLAFYKEHPHVFSNDIKRQVIETAREIAQAFAGINQAEQRMLEELESAFYAPQEN